MLQNTEQFQQRENFSCAPETIWVFFFPHVAFGAPHESIGELLQFHCVAFNEMTDILFLKKAYCYPGSVAMVIEGGL